MQRPAKPCTTVRFRLQPPYVTLGEAREKKDQAKKQIPNGVDPSVFKIASKQSFRRVVEGNLEFVAREWHLKNSQRWSIKNAELLMGRLENYIFPWLGACSIAEITFMQLLETLRRIESRGALETAHRVYQLCGQIFCYAVATGRAVRDPTGDLRR